MTALLAAAIAVMAGAAVRLLLERDLVRIVVGTVLLSNGANLLLMAASLSRGQSPMAPLVSGVPASDPVVQALTLTSIVISFGMTTLVLTLLYRVHAADHLLDSRAVVEAEKQEEAKQERSTPP